MSRQGDPSTLFDRLRRASALRVVLILAAMLASQTSLACAMEATSAAQDTEIIATEESGEDCCALCLDCAHCGGCHSFAVNPRDAFAQFSFAGILTAKLTAATAAPTSWTPPALLRPPIHAA
jgi:hypothetical protein